MAVFNNKEQQGYMELAISFN